jgi:hypothetical protein
VFSTTNTKGVVNINVKDTNLSCPSPNHPTFSTFNTHLTNLEVAPFRLVGHSRTIATTSIGQITLDHINVNVSTSLKGLQGLKGMATIESVDVQGGTTEGITLGITGQFAPSSLPTGADFRISFHLQPVESQIDSGRLACVFPLWLPFLELIVFALGLQLLRDGANLGTALLPALTLNMGNNTVHAKSTFEVNNRHLFIVEGN